MDALSFFTNLNSALDVPVTFIFLFAGLFLTVWTLFPQIFAFSRAWFLFKRGIPRIDSSHVKTIGAGRALFAAMGTSIGMGTIVGPSLAIVAGGPGALFWLLLYAFLGSATKMAEVLFSLHFRIKLSDGKIVGGPAAYLRFVHPALASWYGLSTVLLFAGWSGIQARALSEILACQGVPELLSGALLALFIFVVLTGGAQRVGALASKLVPAMFFLYVSLALWVLATNPCSVIDALLLIMRSAFSCSAIAGGALGGSLFLAMREGTYKGVFITESGMGTASIPHALSDAKYPIDQGILALYSVAADSFLCLLSGLLVVSSGVWRGGMYSNTLMYEVFRGHFAGFGTFFFTICICLFIITTAIGNSFNGGQSFASFTNYKGLNCYYAFAAFAIFLSSIAKVPLVWAIMDFVLPFVAIPNLLGVVYLAIVHRSLFKIPHS